MAHFQRARWSAQSLSLTGRTQKRRQLVYSVFEFTVSVGANDKYKKECNFKSSGGTDTILFETLGKASST